MKNQNSFSEELIFEEKQPLYKNKIVLFIFIIISGIAVFVSLQTKVASSIWATSAIILLFCISLLKLKTKVYSDVIKVSISPFLLYKTIEKEDILEVEDVKYNPLLDWGGWGIRFNLKGVAYNMYGDRGVKLTMKSGKIILIGSQKSHLLCDAILKS